MSETEKKEVQETADIYKKLPPYLRGKLDGYAEAIKTQRETAEVKEDPEDG